MNMLRRFSILLLAALLMPAAGCGSTAARQSTGEYLDDGVITSKVKAAIFNEPSLEVLQIKVETYDNVVQLSGFVPSAGDMDKAVGLARAVDGVRSVRNDMVLR